MSWPNPYNPQHIARLAGRRAQIDGLRTIAMAGVLYVHFLDPTPATEHLRVSLFFVVSGFLITHLLISARARKGVLLPVNFYIRRVLRLLPPLLVLVAFGYATDADGFRQVGYMHLLQLSGVAFALQENFHPWIAAHLWSLNSLEQFYLLCPLLILYFRLPTVHFIVAALWVLIVFVRANGDHLGLDRWWTEMVINQDPILAGMMTYLLCLNMRFALFVRGWLCAGSALLVLASPIFLWSGFGVSDSYRLMCEPALSIIVAGAFFGYRGPVGWALQSPPARFMSKISYGVYVYHLPVWWALGTPWPWLYEKTPFVALILSAATIVTAILSWYLLEAPLQRLKVRFPTRRPPAEAPAMTLA